MAEPIFDTTLKMKVGSLLAPFDLPKLRATRVPSRKKKELRKRVKKERVR